MAAANGEVVAANEEVAAEWLQEMKKWLQKSGPPYTNLLPRLMIIITIILIRRMRRSEFSRGVESIGGGVTFSVFWRKKL